MSDQGRYDYDITTGNRSYENRSSGRGSSGYSRNSDSMFDMGGSRDRDRDRGDDRMGGWAGSGRTSAYDDDTSRNRGRWTQDRENLSWGSDSDDGRNRSGSDRVTYRSRDYDRGHDRDRGERMSSGWGGLGGEDMGRNRSRSRRDRDEHYSRDDERRGLPREETSRLIASNKVEGTAVYGRNGERLGSVYNFMVGKRSGKVEYAVMSYGGFLGMGQRYYPLPWDVLDYDTREGGYRVHLTEDDLRDAPSFDRSSEPEFNRDYDRHVHNYYGTNR